MKLSGLSDKAKKDLCNEYIRRVQGMAFIPPGVLASYRKAKFIIRLIEEKEKEIPNVVA